MKILIVEDEEALMQMMARALGEIGFVVECASTCAAAAQKIKLYEYECVVLDLMLPDGDGLDLLQLLHKRGRAERVIITSAKGSVEDKVRGLELGADDYLPKPFHLAELQARVRSMVRRGRERLAGLTIGNITLNPDDRSVTVGNTPLKLLNKEYHILHYFMTRPARVVDKQALAEAVWGDDADQSDNFNYVYQQVANLKRKLREAGATAGIRAVYGFGYKMEVE